MSGLFSDFLFEALANGLWRGVALTVAAAILLRVFKRTTAAERYAVWLAVLVVIAVAPFVEVAFEMAQPAEPVVAYELLVSDAFAADWVAPTNNVVSEAAWRPVEVAAAPFLLAWLAVGALLAMRLSRRSWLAVALKRGAAHPNPELASAVDGWERVLAAKRVGATRVSHDLSSPAAVGWFAPAVLLPPGAEAEVQCADLEMLWRHEQAHVSRRDDWTQLLSECLFTVAWFHPAIYWVRRHLEKERELACDEAVLEGGVEAHRYAGALGRWAERAAMSELPAGVMGLGRSRALIIRRIEMLLSPSRILRRSGNRLAFGAGLIAAVAGVAVLTVAGPTAIRAQSGDVDVYVEPVVVVPVAEPTVVGPGLWGPEVDGPKVVGPVLVQPEVRIEVPAPVKAPKVHVEPVLLGQVAAPEPPAPPVAPRPSPIPAPAAVPAPPAPPAQPEPPAPPRRDREAREQAWAAAEQARRWREELRPEMEEIRREAQRMREYVQESIRPQQEKLGEAARKLAEEHRTAIQPLAKQMAELGAKMGQAFSSTERDELQRKMEEVAKRIEVLTQRPEMQRLEEEMSRIEIDMKPFEERMKQLGEQLEKKHEALEKARREFEESNQ